jgi:hypothetical protein
MGPCALASDRFVRNLPTTLEMDLVMPMHECKSKVGLGCTYIGCFRHSRYRYLGMKFSNWHNGHHVLNTQAMLGCRWSGGDER